MTLVKSLEEEVLQRELKMLRLHAKAVDDEVRNALQMIVSAAAIMDPSSQYIQYIYKGINRIELCLSESPLFK